MVEIPKYKSDIPITTKGIRVPTILFLKVVELNNAKAVIGAKFGGWGTNLNKIANTTNNKIRCSLFIIYKYRVAPPQGLEPWTKGLWVLCSNQLS